eukprot:6471786-Amphidinium_carterae.2
MRSTSTRNRQERHSSNRQIDQDYMSTELTTRKCEKPSTAYDGHDGPSLRSCGQDCGGILQECLHRQQARRSQCIQGKVQQRKRKKGNTQKERKYKDDNYGGYSGNPSYCRGKGKGMYTRGRLYQGKGEGKCKKDMATRASTVEDLTKPTTMLMADQARADTTTKEKAEVRAKGHLHNNNQSHSTKAKITGSIISCKAVQARQRPTTPDQ